MNNTQRILLAIYLPFTFLVLVFDHLYPGAEFVQYIKYTLMTTLFLSVIIARKKYPVQKVMATAFLFMVIADFFLVFSTTIDNLQTDLSPLGIAGFLIAYLFLITAYQRNFSVNKAVIITAVPFILIYIYVFLTLLPNLKGIMLIGTLIFGVVLCWMAWSSICTIYRGYYSEKAALMIALSGILMFIGDIGVAYSIFHPLYAGIHVPWLKNVIWATYIPGWTLLAVVINEERLRLY